MRDMIERLKTGWHERAVVFKAVSFALVGLVNTAVDLGIFSFAYYYLNMPIVAANAISWIIAVTGSYVMNSTITFAPESGGKLGLKTYVGFALSQVGGFLANTAVVFAASYFIPVIAGKILAIGASFLVNFSLSHFVVFRNRSNGPA